MLEALRHYYCLELTGALPLSSRNQRENWSLTKTVTRMSSGCLILVISLIKPPTWKVILILHRGQTTSNGSRSGFLALTSLGELLGLSATCECADDGGVHMTAESASSTAPSSTAPIPLSAPPSTSISRPLAQKHLSSGSGHPGRKARSEVTWWQCA